jgi:myo-inositol-1(or 4)-monophosphatase
MSTFRSFIVHTALQAGEIMQKNFSLGMKREWKADHTPLTITDTTINSLIISSIKTHFPTHGILGEEESLPLTNAAYVWVCDPVDGTIPFSHGVPVSTFSLALTKNGKSILGVVYDPFMKRLVIAEKGKGAYMNDKKIQVSSANEFMNTVVAMEYWNIDKYDYDAVHNNLASQGTKVVTYCSFLYEGILVASGEFSAAIFAGHTPWDAASIKIIMDESGGTCTNLDGEDQRYDREINGVIIGNQTVHEKLVQLIRSKRK